MPKNNTTTIIIIVAVVLVLCSCLSSGYYMMNKKKDDADNKTDVSDNKIDDSDNKKETTTKTEKSKPPSKTPSPPSKTSLTKRVYRGSSLKEQDKSGTPPPPSPPPPPAPPAPPAAPPPPPPPSPWKCLTVPSYNNKIGIRLNGSGDVQCYSKDGNNCWWETCPTDANGTNLSDAQPVTCTQSGTRFNSFDSSNRTPNWCTYSKNNYANAPMPTQETPPTGPTVQSPTKADFINRGTWYDLSDGLGRTISNGFIDMRNIKKTDGTTLPNTEWLDYALTKAIDGGYDTIGFQDGYALFLGNYNPNGYRYDRIIAYRALENPPVNDFGLASVNRVYSTVAPNTTQVPSPILSSSTPFDSVPYTLDNTTVTTTPYETFTKINNIYKTNDLNKLDVSCNNKGINNFQLTRSTTNTDQFAYSYKCSNGGNLNTSKIYQRSTQEDDAGDGNYVYFDRHDVRCPPQSVLSQFKTINPSGNRIKYDYKCIPSNKPLICRTVNNSNIVNGVSKSSARMGDDTLALTGQNIACDSDEVLNQFQLNNVGGDSTISYKYQCCKHGPSNDFIYALSDQNKLYRCAAPCTNNNWEEINKSGSLEGVQVKNIASGKNHIYTVDVSNNVYKCRAPCNDNNWQYVTSNNIQKVSADGDHVYGIDTSNNLFKCTASCNDGNWQNMNKNFKIISSNKNSIYGIDASDNIFKCAAPCSDNNWQQITKSGALENKSIKDITIDNNYIYSLDSSDNIYRCETPCATGNWQKIDGLLSNISVGTNYMYGVNSQKNTFRCNTPCTGANWENINGSYVNITGNKQ